jgi:hypothetical protein
MGIIRDTWRAVLALVVGVLLMEAAGIRRHPAVATHAPPVETRVFIQQPPQPPPQPERPLRRVASAVTEVFDSVIGVVR